MKGTTRYLANVREKKTDQLFPSPKEELTSNMKKEERNVWELAR